jgi:probable HAF family extracellular repeat protein
MKATRPLHQVLLACALLFLATIAHADRKSEWTLVDIGSLSAVPGTQAFGLDNAGDVVGSSAVPGAFGCCLHPFLWRNGTMTDISPPGTREGQAVAVNASGTVALQMDGAQIFLSRDGSATRLPFAGVVRDIDNAGAVVGGAQVGFFTHAFIYRDGVLQDLGTFGGTHSEAFAVNNGGVVVGSARMPDNAHDYAFVFKDGAMRNVDTVRGFGSHAFDVNDGGTVVGAFTDDSLRTFAFVWDEAGGFRKLLDMEATIALSINNRGDVVGTIGTAGSFLLSDGVLMRLETLPAVRAAGFTQVMPQEINERGWIAGWASGPAGTRAILLMPKAT